MSERFIVDDAGTLIDMETRNTYDYVSNVVGLLNELVEENKELRLQLNLCSDQRNEFHRGARENANRVGKLKKENEQLKSKNRGLQSELQIFKDDVTHSNLQINKLADENEQFQKKNDNLVNMIARVQYRADLIKEENEQLKEEIKDLNDVLARYEEKELQRND